MRLNGLTMEQCELLDQMWAIETIEELRVFIESQDPSVQREIMTLRELLILGGIDDEIDEMKTYPDAEQMLRGIMK
jgi:hypothetical protein